MGLKRSAATAFEPHAGSLQQRFVKQQRCVEAGDAPVVHYIENEKGDEGIVLKVPREVDGRYYGYAHLAGNGSFGCIIRCHDSHSGGDMIIKRQATDDTSSCEASYREVRTLIHMLKTSPHPSIISLKDCWWVENFFYIVEEGLDCNLSEYVSDIAGRSVGRAAKKLKYFFKKFPNEFRGSVRKLDEAQRRVVITNSFAGIAHLHRCNMLHRDIKPENICLRLGNVNGSLGVVDCKLVDLGSCRRPLMSHHEEKGKFPDMTHGKYVCTYPYRAPEITGNAVDYTFQLDVWSVGCCVAEMVLGEQLFPGDEKSLIGAQKAFKGRDLAWFQKKFPTASLLEQTLLCDSLQFCPQMRKTADQLLLAFDNTYSPEAATEYHPEHYDYENVQEVKCRLKACVAELREWQESAIASDCTGPSPGYSASEHSSSLSALSTVTPVVGSSKRTAESEDDELVNLRIHNDPHYVAGFSVSRLASASSTFTTPPPPRELIEGAQSTGLTDSTFSEDEATLVLMEG